MKSGRISIGGFDRLIRITKYTSLACLTLAILSTLVLNIVSSYSYSEVNSNAEPVTNSSTSTLANTANTELDPAGISISISSYPSATGDTNDPNLSLSIPQGGGLVAGRHTVTVNTGSDISHYDVYLNSSSDNTDLVNSADSTVRIESVEYDDFSYHHSELADNHWGVAFPGYLYEAQYGSLDQWDMLIDDPDSVPDFYTFRPVGIPPNSVGTNPYGGNKIDTYTGKVYYIVRVDHPEQLLAGNYTAQVVYTVVTELHEPTITNIEPSTYELGSNEVNTITITGKYLSTTSKVYLTNTDTSADNSGTQYDCTNLQLLSNDASGNTTLTCNIPTDTTNPAIDDPGTYNLTIETEGGTTTKEDAITYTKPSICRNNDPDSDCQVDIDDNMIPVTYDEERQVWIALNEQQINSLTGIWYDYGAKKWANAVTVKNPALYKESKDVNEDDILGYWVYIPRYAYEVQRRDAIDRVVDPQNFDIVFQTADEKNTPKESCNSADEIWVSKPFGNSSTNSSNAGPNSDNVLAKDYRTGCWPNNRTYIANSNNTTWATNPAFTWGDTELNGIWVGKFETTGKVNAPTVKPNQHANISEYIGEFYTAAKNIGVEDTNNQGGNTVSNITPNSHHLDKATSHMLKNSEWGAVAYLSASKYGAGVNGTKINSAYPANGKDADGDPTSASQQARYGITGCGPKSETSELSYSSVTVNGETVSLPALSADHIEDPLACGDKAHAYNGEIGVLASTTNTIYGIYDMSGGAYEYVMGNLTGYDNQSETSDSLYMRTQAKPPYVDLYKESQGFDYSSSNDTNPAWSASTSAQYYNNDVCTWGTCGGHVLHETKQYQSVSSAYQSWGSDDSNFVYSSNRWFHRGGSAGSGSGAGLFFSSLSNGFSGSYYGFRAALLALPDGQ